MGKTSQKKPIEENNSKVHVKIDFEHAINCKKQLLVGQIDLLRLMKGVNRYSLYRRRELEVREQLKKESAELRGLVEEFCQSLPLIEEGERFRIKNDLDSINKREIMQSDLESIKEKLSRLGGL